MAGVLVGGPAGGGGGAGTQQHRSKRGLFFLVSAVIVVQLVSWRGTARLKALSYAPQEAGAAGAQLHHTFARRHVPMEREKEESPPSVYLDKGKARLLDEERSTSTYGGAPIKTSKTKKKKKKKKKKKEKNGKGKHPESSTTSSSTTGHSATTSLLRPSTSASVTPECKPLPTSASPLQQCRHVRERCPPSGHLDYLQFYYCIGVDDHLGADRGRLSASRPTPAPPNRSLPLSPEDSTNVDAQKKNKTPVASGRQRAMRALALTSIIVWMLFLFSWVGLVASDFFCPNLGTIAARLGLSESTAGVTFLAFGNGSPDVFSTFGAMRTGSGSLAIGELIGAASFIVSVISGSMMLIAPFRVKPYPFLRDVGFFTVAVALTMISLFDGKLLFSECLGLIALYFTYAATVIIGSWWQERQRRRRLLISSVREEYSPGLSEDEQTHVPAGADMERHSSNQSLRRPASPMRPPMSAVEYDPDIDPFEGWAAQQDDHAGTRSPSISPSLSPLLQTQQDLPSSGSGDFNNRLQRFRAGIIARHSLLGAVEFRDVVRNLQNESSVDRSAEVFQSRDPESYLPHTAHNHLSPGNGHHRRNLSVVPRSQKLQSAETWEETRRALHRSRSVIGAGVPADSRTTGIGGIADAVSDPWREHQPGDDSDPSLQLPGPALPLRSSDAAPQGRSEEQNRTKLVLPRLAIRRATGTSGDLPIGGGRPGQRVRNLRDEPLPLWRQAKRSFKPTLKALFPSLRHLHEKSWLGLFIAFVTAPAIFLLNMTLPVVDDAAEQEYMTGEKDPLASRFNPSGNIRLEGEEAPLQVHEHLNESYEDDEDHNGDGSGRRGIITLSSSVDNPWDSSTSSEGVTDNRKDHLDVATALRRLPQESSPLLMGSNPRSPHSSGANSAGTGQPAELAGETSSVSNEVSCFSSESHKADTQASRTFLVVSQCALAPPFCVWAITSSAHSAHVATKTTIALFCGLAIATIVLVVRLRCRRSVQQDFLHWQRAVVAFGWSRVAVGFIVSILYIMTIVDEVVSILQTLGLILGLSDAILGLTVFAMGNSLGDLVANITIARMGHPIMAISACFAGPLLNLLLGIGISGSWLLSGGRGDSTSLRSLAVAPSGSNSAQHLLSSGVGSSTSARHYHAIYHIDISPTLSVSGLGLLVILLGTLVSVPLNGFYLNRTIGTALIVTYAVIMSINVGVELYHIHRGLDM